MWSISHLSTSDSLSDGRQEELLQSVPAWSGFSLLVSSEHEIRLSNVGYLPVIPASPTEISTVYLLLKRSVATAERLGQAHIVVVLDQAIYAKALEVMWKNPAEFERIVPRMGAFHVACTFMAVIGK